MIRNEAIKSIRRHWLLSAATILYLAIVLFCSAVLGANIFGAKTRSDRTFQTTGATEYRLYDTIEPLTPVIKNPEQVAAVKAYWQAISTDMDYLFCERVMQPADIAGFRGTEVFASGYEYGDEPNQFERGGLEYTTVKQLRANTNAIQYAGLENQLLYGRMLQEADMSLGLGASLPVVLGYEYLPFYSLGDTMSCLYPYSVPVTYEVVGFLNEGATIAHRGEIVFLDRYILAASVVFNYTPETEDELMSQGFTLFQKLNGTIVLSEDLSIEWLMNRLEAHKLRYGMFDLHLLEYSNFAIESLKFLTYTNIEALLFMAGLLALFAIFTLISSTIYKLENDRDIMRAILVAGYGNRTLWAIKLVEFTILYATGCLLGASALLVVWEQLFTALLVPIAVAVAIPYLGSVAVISTYFKWFTGERLMQGENNDKAERYL